MNLKFGNKTSVTKFLINGKAMYAKILWRDNDYDLFNIYLYDGDYCWSGRFSNEFAKQFMHDVSENEEEYISNAHKGLTDPTDLYKYDFTAAKNNDKSATFTWKRRFEDSTVLLIHGSVPVHRDEDSGTKDNLIDFLLNENKDLRTTINEYSKKNESLSLDFDKCKSELQKFVDVKESLEASLYGKFVQLLNAKKKRIQLLEDNLQKFEQTQSNAMDSELD